MTDNAKRTVRQVTLVVETTGLTDQEHERRVFWAESNLLNANQKMDGAFVAVVVNDPNGNTRLTAAGTPTTETSELIDELKAS